MDINVIRPDNILLKLLGSPYSDLWNGIVFGGSNKWPYDLYNQFISTGTIHLVAVSGMNLTLLVGLSSILLKKLNKLLANIVNIVIITGYVYIVGLSPSVVRAAIMCYLSAFALILGKIKSSSWLLIVTVCIMVLYSPEILVNVSFQLSVLSTIGIILLAKNTKDYEQLNSTTANIFNKRNIYKENKFNIISYKVYYYIISEFKIILSSQLFTLPLIILYFGRLSLLSPVTNILISWNIPVLMVLGLLACILGEIWLPLSYPLAWIAWLFLKFDLEVINIFSKINWATFNF